METQVLQVRGECIGYTHVGSPMMFAVPIQEIKPKASVSASVHFRFTGSDGERLIVGRKYSLLVVIHGTPRQYEAIAAND